MILSQEQVRRMIDSGAGSNGGSGGGGSIEGFATQSWVYQNFLSIEFFSKLFTAYKAGENTGDPDVAVTPNDTSGTFKSIEAMFGFWTEQYLSALGQGSGGGGGTILTEPLASINAAGLGTPTQANVGIIWNGSAWGYGSTGGGGGGGSVTEVRTGIGLVGGPITTTGEIAISSTYLGYIEHGETAYDWGNHADAGYATQTWVGQQGFLTSSAISDMATKTWVGQQGYITSSAISDMATKTWVGQQGFLTSSAISDMATKTWVGQQGYITSSAISDMATKTWVGQQGFAYASSLSNYLPLSGGRLTGALYIGNNSSGVSPYIYWGDGSYVYIGEDSDDHMKLYGSKGINLTTGTGYDLQWNAKTIATQEWVGQQGYLTSVSFSQLTTHPTTLAGYGITDAKIQNGTITLGSSTITPITTETDPTVPAWAKASTKPSYSFSEITGSVAFSQLPTMYWANVAVSNSSDNNTSPQFGHLRLRPGTANYGSYLRFGDGDYVYLYEDTDDHLTIYGSKGIVINTGSSYKVGVGTTSPMHKLDVAGDINATQDITTAQAVNARNIELSFTSPFIDFHHASSSADYTSRLITTDYGTLNLQSKTSGGTDKLSGFVVGANYDGSFIQIGNIKIVYDSSNNALKIIKSDGTAANLYATGGVAALQTS